MRFCRDCTTCVNKICEILSVIHATVDVYFLVYLYVVVCKPLQRRCHHSPKTYFSYFYRTHDCLAIHNFLTTLWNFSEGLNNNNNNNL